MNILQKNMCNEVGTASGSAYLNRNYEYHNNGLIINKKFDYE